MAWGDKNDHTQGPWGRPPSSGGGGNQPPSGGGKPPGGPDFDPEAWLRQLQAQLKQMIPGEHEGAKGFVLLAVIVALLWMSSGIYFVKADEQGVVLRFGQYIRTVGAGLNYHLPYPVETVKTPKVTAVNRVEIGYRSGLRSKSGQDSIPEESLMLTGDENIIDVHFEVQWKIRNAPDFLFNVRDPEDTVKSVSESAMREVIGKEKIASVLAEGKLQVAQNSRKLLQETLDNYKSGIEVVTVNLLKADPPSQVIDAFRDVQTALADLETSRNQAEAYRNDILPKARGQAQQMILDAEGYKQQVVAGAQGQASRFMAVYNQFKLAKDVTKRRMYLETMEDILSGMNKVVIEGKQGAVPYLPLPAMAPKLEESGK